MNTIKKTCLSSNLKNRDRKNVRNEEVAAKNKRKSHSLKYAANSGLKENKMKVGKLVHGLSDSMLLFFYINHMHLNITIHCFLQINGQVSKF